MGRKETTNGGDEEAGLVVSVPPRNTHFKDAPVSDWKSNNIPRYCKNATVSHGKKSDKATEQDSESTPRRTEKNDEAQSPLLPLTSLHGVDPANNQNELFQVPATPGAVRMLGGRFNSRQSIIIIDEEEEEKEPESMELSSIVEPKEQRQASGHQKQNPVETTEASHPDDMAQAQPVYEEDPSEREAREQKQECHGKVVAYTVLACLLLQIVLGLVVGVLMRVKRRSSNSDTGTSNAQYDDDMPSPSLL